MRGNREAQHGARILVIAALALFGPACGDDARLDSADGGRDGSSDADSSAFEANRLDGRQESSMDGEASEPEDAGASEPEDGSAAETADPADASIDSPDVDTDGHVAPDCAYLSEDDVCQLLYAFDFEQSAQGWTVEGDNASWELAKAEDTGFGPAPKGTQIWVTGASAGYADDEASYLVSPDLDFSEADADPILLLRQAFALEPGVDEVMAEVSIDSGPWLPIDWTPEAYNWVDELWGTWTGASGGDKPAWRVAHAALPGAAGERHVRVRLSLSSDSSLTDLGFALAEAIFLKELSDVAVSRRRSPPTCPSDEGWSLPISLRGFGNAPARLERIRIQGPNGEIVKPFDREIQPGEVIDVDLRVADLPPGEVASIEIMVEGKTDFLRDNDVAAIPLLATPLVTDIPYAEDFEVSATGWFAFDESSTPLSESNDWVWAEEPFGYGSRAASGEHGWVIDINEASLGPYYLYTPCFDLSSLTEDPWLSFSYVHDMHAEFEMLTSWVYVEASTDGGATWEFIGRSDDDFESWYPPSPEDEPEGFWGLSDADGNWRMARRRLDDLAGRDAVMLRWVAESDFDARASFALDSVRVGTPPRDIAVQGIDIPSVACTDIERSLLVDIANVGTTAADDVEIVVSVDGTDVATLPLGLSLMPGETTTESISLATALSAPGTHEVTATVAASGDAVASNDEMHRAVHTLDYGGGVGYFEDFESSDGAFLAYGYESSWQWGEPNGFVLLEAAGGDSAWVTNLEGEANVYEKSFLVTPCFDFGNHPADPVLRFQHIYDNFSETEAWMDISVDGGLSWTKLGTSASGVGWYDLDEVWDSSNADLWHIAAHTLEDAGGEPSVMLRWAFRTLPILATTESEGHGIDDVQITETLP